MNKFENYIEIRWHLFHENDIDIDLVLKVIKFVEKRSAKFDAKTQILLFFSSFIVQD